MFPPIKAIPVVTLTVKSVHCPWEKIGRSFIFVRDPDKEGGDRQREREGGSPEICKWTRSDTGHITDIPQLLRADSPVLVSDWRVSELFGLQVHASWTSLLAKLSLASLLHAVSSISWAERKEMGGILLSLSLSLSSGINVLLDRAKCVS